MKEIVTKKEDDHWVAYTTDFVERTKAEGETESQALRNLADKL